MGDVYCRFCAKELQDSKPSDSMCITDVGKCSDRYFERYARLASISLFDSVKLLWEVNHLKR